MNNIAPLSQKQKEYLLKTKDNWFNVAEGGKRGGKNVLNTLAYCLTLENHPDKLHLVAGVSTATARLNILDCDGYGLINYFEHRYKEGKYKDRPCLYVQTVTGPKIILVSGGGKNGDERYIKGNTYGTAYITEANECAQPFLKEVFDRTISSSNRKIFHDLNPKTPQHWYYTEILDFHEKQQLQDKNYGYNYGHFTIADNFSISDTKMRNVLKTYQKGTVWYDRDIRGIRKAVEGAIYKVFTENRDKYYVDKPDFDYIQIGLDFGGNNSAHAICASGIKNDYSKLTVLMTDRMIATGTNPNDLYSFVDNFVNRVRGKYGNRIVTLYADSAEQTLINGLRAKGFNFSIKNSLKNPILDRIRCTTSLMVQNRFFLTHDCKSLELAFENAVYDEKALDDVRLDDGTSDIDSLDSFEYSFESRLRQYSRY